MRLLFVKLKHIGDGLLLTPTLQATKQAYPDAQIWVVVRKGTEGILKGCPSIDRVLTAAAPESRNRGPGGFLSELQLLRQLRAQQFDWAFELTDGDRGRWFAGLSRAPNRCVNTSFYKLNPWWRLWFNRQSTRPWTNGHRVEKDFFAVTDFLPIGSQPPPLVFDPKACESWSQAPASRRYAVLHPGTRWRRKRWPLERWTAVGQHLLQHLDQICISAGPDPEEVEGAQALATQLGPRCLTTAGKLSWAQLAGLLRRATLFVGVDTAAMHLAAACQCPTVALFGPSSQSQWHPWMVRHVMVSPDGVPWNGSDTTEGLMDKIRLQDVTAACDRILVR